ncbi:hypothetical protein NL108_015224 [Boleophthalmus pectinirostris]|nr:hypothetical protein NL108_015224 [Boleophthalmus pectinirostris]
MRGLMSSVSETPETAKYHEDFDRSRGRGSALGLDEPGMERYHRANQMIGEAGFSRGTHPQSADMDRRPGGIIVAPVLPGAYQQVAQQQQQYGYMHQTSLSSVRSRVYRALYDYAAQDHDEVSFKDGDVIVNAQHIDEGWMYGTVQRTGQSGMLPANYVHPAH